MPQKKENPGKSAKQTKHLNACPMLIVHMYIFLWETGFVLLCVNVKYELNFSYAAQSLLAVSKNFLCVVV